VQVEGDHKHHGSHAPLTTLLLLLLLAVCRTCWFHEASVSADGGVQAEGDHKHHGSHAPLTTLLALEHTIQQRREAMQQQQGAGSVTCDRHYISCSTQPGVGTPRGANERSTKMVTLHRPASSSQQQPAAAAASRAAASSSGSQQSSSQQQRQPAVDAPNMWQQCCLRCKNQTQLKVEARVLCQLSAVVG
jgi:hypothetical protein